MARREGGDGDSWGCVCHWREARGARDHAGAAGHEAWCRGDDAGGVEDLFFEFLFDTLLLALVEDLLLFFVGDEAGVDADAEFSKVEYTGDFVSQEFRVRVETGSYMAMMQMANRAFACLQYAMLLGWAATLHFLVMYHGGPGWGCFGSDMSLPPWYRTETMYRMKVAPWMVAAMGGKRRCIMWRGNLTINRKVLSTPMTKL